MERREERGRGEGDRDAGQDKRINTEGSNEEGDAVMEGTQGWETGRKVAGVTQEWIVK